MADLRAYKPLRLMAADVDDLNIMSSCLQDAVAKIGDFAYLPAERRFAFVANRFVWECAGNRKSGPFARVRAGVHFGDVTAVKQLSLKAQAKDAVVSILAARFEEGEDGAGAIILEFAGGGAIRIEADCINIELQDISDPWRTKSRPQHKD